MTGKWGAKFHEDWFNPDSCRQLAELARTVRSLDGTVVEVGSWEGRSTIALAGAADNVRAVDTWQGSPGEISADLATERDVFAQFEANLAAAQVTNVDVYRMGWRDYFAAHRDPVKLCFIDATHTYDEVFDNITAVLPLMVPGGIICGDDVHHEPVRRAVIDILGDKTLTAATLWWSIR